MVVEQIILGDWNNWKTFFSISVAIDKAADGQR